MPRWRPNYSECINPATTTNSKADTQTDSTAFTPTDAAADKTTDQRSIIDTNAIAYANAYYNTNIGSIHNPAY